jgi:superfamily II DNA or RNA helicase
MNFTYQTTAATEVLKNALNKSFKASILAACPNAGKTTISHIILNKYVQIYPQSNIVVLTHGTNVLREQYLSELKTPNVKINFTFGDFGDNVQVSVGLPQSINNLQIKEIDLLLIDEAHEYSQGAMVQDIIAKYNVKHIIYMTGSPSQFNKHNQTNSKKYAIHYVSAEELMDSGVFSALDMDLIVSKSPSVCAQFDQGLVQAVKKGADVKNIMIAVKSINDAKLLRNHLISLGRKVSMSTSENDPDNLEINKFRKGLTDALIVVDKGILGFNAKQIGTLFDLKAAPNLDASFQLLARVLRKGPQKQKNYFRLASDNNNGVIYLHKLVSLMKKDIFRNYNGSNLQAA